MKKLFSLLLAVTMLALACGCAKENDPPASTGSDQNVIKDGPGTINVTTSTESTDNSDSTEPESNSGSGVVDETLPKIVGTFSDIQKEIQGIDVLSYSPFSSDKETSNTNSETMSTLYDNDSEKTANISESKTFAIFPKDRDDLCLVCSGLKIVKVLFRGNVWDFSNVGFNFDLTDGAPGSFIGKEYQQYSTESHFACTDDTLFFTSYSEKPLVIHDDKAYRVDEKLLFGGNSSRYAIITDGKMTGFETRNYDLIPENQTLEVNLKKMIDDNMDPLRKSNTV